MTEEKKPKFVFECQKTGRCCELRQNIEVFIEDIERWSQDGTYTKTVSELDIATLPNGIPIALIIKKKEAEGKSVCTFLEGNDCNIYTSRPISCIAYPLGYNGENHILLDKECTGLNKGAMNKEQLVEMREAARAVHESRGQMVRILPIFQATIVKRLVEESEKMMEKLSNEEKEDLKKMLKTKEEEVIKPSEKKPKPKKVGKKKGKASSSKKKKTKKKKGRK